MDVIRRLGNQAVHQARPVPQQDALAALRELFHVAFWLAQHYARRVADRPAAGLQFRADRLPRPAAIDLAAEQAASRAEGVFDPQNVEQLFYALEEPPCAKTPSRVPPTCWAR
ncbi:hypothetical protein [Acidovorax sp. SUPP3334]|uniref:hypothetical protein n=1 Tax=Acidovorax sp. SUPP3334 TaxID=2920881 RepID=UPI0023DE4F02|nr:hypothetical protein [Acidovorax sp. SUPP3334]GKT23480.1 hypothetical protein AVHM3334_11765 [Acidovorax sp. SUPP3334]